MRGTQKLGFAGLGGLAAGIALMACIAATDAGTVPADEPATVVTGEATPAQQLGTDDAGTVGAEPGAVESSAPVAADAVAPDAPVVAPVVEGAEQAAPRECEDDTDTGCVEPPLPVGVTVYFPTLAEAQAFLPVLPCWEALDGRGVCWVEGATGADVQG